jgi:hypothetical protein
VEKPFKIDISKQKSIFWPGLVVFSAKLAKLIMGSAEK